MPDKKDHLAQAEHNQDVTDYLLLKPTPCPDWVATTAFYKAVHLVDAVLAVDADCHPQDHVNREYILKRNPRYLELCKHYIPLKNISIIARYLSELQGKGYHTFDDFMNLEDVKREVLNHRLRRIETSVNTLLSKKPPSNKPR